MSLNGIDISMHQGGLSIASVKTDFVIVKATEGVGYKDPQFENLISQAINAGKKIGIYHFCRNDLANTAIAEADWFLNVAGKYAGKAILILDWESSKSSDVAYAKTWLDRVKEKTGFTPMIYMNQATENNYDWSSVAKSNYGLWGAKYRDYGIDYNYDMTSAGTPFSAKHWEVVAMWQWTSVGHLDGYGSNLDCNIFYGDFATWDKYAGGSQPKPTPIPTPTPKPEPTPITNTKYKIGTPFYSTGLWTQSNGGEWIPASQLFHGKGVYTVGDTIYEGAEHPYQAMRNGVIIGFANDKCIDDEPSVPNGKAPVSQPTVSSGTKYGIGTKVCTNTLSTTADGNSKIYKGDWSGVITNIVKGAKYPYLLNNGTGWTNDTGIDTDPHFPK